MDPERKNRIDKALATYFFGCNIAFVNVESQYFLNLLRELNPQYTPPSRKTLSTKLLDNMYDEYRNSLRSEETQKGILLIDGWKNSVANTKNVVAVVRTSRGQNIFLESWNFNEERETGEALSLVVNECIDIALNEFNIGIYVVISDNASNMISMGQRVDLWHVTCHSHSGNLLFKSLTDDDFDQKVTNVVKEFRSPNLESQIQNLGGNKMILAGETRWCSKRDSYRRCLMNVQVMRNIIRDNQLKDRENQFIFKNDVIETILDEEFEMQLIRALLNYDPICELVNSCQKSNCSIAFAIEKWLTLELPYGENNQFNRILSERLQKVINPYGLAANYLHPRYKGRRYSNNLQYVNLKNTFFAENLSAEGLAQLEEYSNQTGMFQRLFDRHYESWQVFWQVARNFNQELSTLAEKLLSIPASTGDLERLFSEWTLVHSKTRNRLKEHRSKKLIVLYYQFRLKYIDLFVEEEEEEND